MSSYKYIFRLNSFEKSLIIGFVFSILCSFVNFQSKCDRISEKVFRLHIIANSDSDLDQRLKLKIRDAIVQKLCNENLVDLNSTKKFVTENLDILQNIAEQEIINNASNYLVRSEVCKSDFCTRKYENVTLPAGDYDALKIIVGEGKGKNWWCVLFPPMCVGASRDKVDCKDAFSENEKEIVEREKNQKYKIKFKIVEIIYFIHKLFRNLINKIQLLIINKI